jgi:hypothetical protein
MLKVFAEALREMKTAGEVEFRSGKTAVFVQLGRVKWDADPGSAAGR